MLSEFVGKPILASTFHFLKIRKNQICLNIDVGVGIPHGCSGTFLGKGVGVEIMVPMAKICLSREY